MRPIDSIAMHVPQVSLRSLRVFEFVGSLYHPSSYAHSLFYLSGQDPLAIVEFDLPFIYSDYLDRRTGAYVAS